MQITQTVSQDLHHQYTVTVPAADLESRVNARLEEMKPRVNLKGFRPGKAPRRILEARIGIAPARQQALQDAIPRYLADAVKEHDVDIIAPPEVDITAGEDEGPVAFAATVEVRPQVIVPGYAGLRVELPPVAVSDGLRTVTPPLASRRLIWTPAPLE